MSSDKFLEIQKKQLEEIKQVDNDKNKLTRGELEKKYEAFAEKYPKTWINILDDNFVVSHLERKIEVYEKFYKRHSHLNNHEDIKLQADMDFGETLAEEFLYPVTGKPSNLDRSRAETIIRKKIEKSGEEIDKSKMEKIQMT